MKIITGYTLAILAIVAVVAAQPEKAPTLPPTSPASQPEPTRPAPPPGPVGANEATKIDRRPIEQPKPWSGMPIVWTSIGHGSVDDATRRVGHDIALFGWKNFLDVKVRPYGFKRLGLHNPFGISPDNQMRWDQAIQAAIFDARRGDPIWGFEFYQALGDWLDEDGDRELWFHVGTDGAEYDASDTFRRSMFLHAIDLMMIRPEQQVFSLDAASDASETSWARFMVDEIERRGARVVIEARPVRGREWLQGRDVLFTQQYDERIYKWPTNDPNYWYSDDELGQITVLFNTHWPYDLSDVVKACIEGGRNVSIWPHTMAPRERALFRAIEAQDLTELRRVVQDWTDPAPTNP